MSRVAVATIHVAALKNNLSLVKKAAPQAKIMAVIKADAYGHGLLPVAQALNKDVDAFVVAHFEEAITLRSQLPEKNIVLLQGYADEIELALLLSHRIQPVIHCAEQIDLLASFVAKNPSEKLSVWLKLDTGMHRLGVSADDFESCWGRLNEMPTVRGNVNVMSHFANADDIAHESNEQQSALFKKITTSLLCEKSMSNSAGLLSRQKDHYQWVRPGIMLYGVSPFCDGSALANNLQPVMNLSSRVIAVTKVKKTQSVGYGSCWTASVDTNVAVVGIGYGDGYPRHVADNTPVLINGKRYPIIGRVSMDMICVDVGQDVCKMGDHVLLWGAGLPVEEIAEKASTIAYELLCQVTARVHFVYEQGL